LNRILSKALHLPNAVRAVTPGTGYFMLNPTIHTEEKIHSFQIVEASSHTTGTTKVTKRFEIATLTPSETQPFFGDFKIQLLDGCELRTSVQFPGMVGWPTPRFDRPADQRSFNHPPSSRNQAEYNVPRHWGKRLR
jgi:hypothetical protein